jgi:hypothetical protein
VVRRLEENRAWYDILGMRDFGEMSWPFKSSEPFDKPAHDAAFQRWKMNMGRTRSGHG